MSNNGGKVSPERLYDPEWFQETIAQGKPVTFRIQELPFEELLVLDEYALQYPGLMFNLRKQRGAMYLLTILPGRHIDEENVKGEP